MHCPVCKSPLSYVERSKKHGEPASITRFRACRNPDCGALFATGEEPPTLQELGYAIAQLPREQRAHLRLMLEGD